MESITFDVGIETLMSVMVFTAFIALQFLLRFYKDVKMDPLTRHLFKNYNRLLVALFTNHMSDMTTTERMRYQQVLDLVLRGDKVEIVLKRLEDVLK